MVATILAAFIQVGVKEWIFKNVEDICHPNQISQLTCPHNQVFYTASAVWWVFCLAHVFFITIYLLFFHRHFYIKGSYWPNASIRYRLHLSSSSLRHIGWSFHPNASVLLATVIPQFMDSLRQHACCESFYCYHLSTCRGCKTCIWEQCTRSWSSWCSSLKIGRGNYHSFSRWNRQEISLCAPSPILETYPRKWTRTCNYGAI